MGWAWSEFDRTEKDVFTVLDTGIIKGHQLANRCKPDIKYFNRRVITTPIIRENVSSLVNKYRPDYVASEDAFYNPKFPLAYGALAICVHTIEKTLYLLWKDAIQHLTTTEQLIQEVPECCVLRKYAPKIMKMMVTGSGSADKTKIARSILQNNSIKLPEVKFDEHGVCTLAEHEYDAVGIGYTFMKTLS